MFKENLVLTFYGQTSLHMGSGVSVSYIDNPIQREKHTDFPLLASSGIKGVIRELALRKWNDKEKVNVVFGPEEGGEEYASCISFTDAKILLYPVRSVKGVFAYITCPYVLNRFKNELKSNGKSDLSDIPSLTNEDKIFVCRNSELKIDNNKVTLEEFVFEIDNSKDIDGLVGKISAYLPEEINSNLNTHFAIVHDNVFRDFVKYAIEIRTRIRIDQTTGTVAEGALFTIELIPSESVFYGFLFINDPYFGIEYPIYNKLKEAKKNRKSFDDEFKNLSEEEKKKIKDEQKERLNKAYQGNYFTATEIKENLKRILDNSIIQLGGDETLGMGLAKVKCMPCENKESQQAGVKN
ncbi:MAG: type III-B CRISPR module RAMP protein Cmr4 [candidate division WOR-3 bacterium]